MHQNVEDCLIVTQESRGTFARDSILILYHEYLILLVECLPLIAMESYLIKDHIIAIQDHYEYSAKTTNTFRAQR